MMSLLDATGAHMFVGSESGLEGGAPIGRAVLLLPDVMIEDYGMDAAKVMRPIFDAVWNATSFERSFNYDEAGRWKSPT